MKQKLTKEQKKALRAERRKNKKGIIQEFKEFITRGNVLDMAIGVIIGAAFKSIVTALTNGILMPIVGFLVNTDDLSEIKQVLRPEVLAEDGTVAVAEIAILWGEFIQTILDFILIALVIFIIVKVINSVHNRLAAIKKILDKPVEEPVQEEAPAPAEPVITELDVLKEIKELLVQQQANKE